MFPSVWDGRDFVFSFSLFSPLWVFQPLDDVFRLFSSSVVVVPESVFQCNTRVIEQDTLTEKEKALRVPRAVNIG